MILKEASDQILKNVVSLYCNKDEYLNGRTKPKFFLSGSILINCKYVSYLVETGIKEIFPDAEVVFNKKEPVWRSYEYMKDLIEQDKNKDLR